MLHKILEMILQSYNYNPRGRILKHREPHYCGDGVLQASIFGWEQGLDVSLCADKASLLH